MIGRFIMIANKKTESPRPDFYRENYMSLNGIWKFAFDDANQGRSEKWYEQLPEKNTCDIKVPFCFQSKESGIEDTGEHSYVWYQTKVKIPNEKATRTFLHFGAVDYEAMIWVNGQYVGGHKGGHTPFSMEITSYYEREKEVTLTVFCKDSYSCEQPRGKQHWNIQTDRCWYTATTGIWQDVWLEFSEGTRLEWTKITPDIDKGVVEVQVFLSEKVSSGILKWELRGEGNGNELQSLEEKTKGCVYQSGSVEVKEDKVRLVISVEYPDPIDNQIHLWSPETPFLYDLCFQLEIEGKTADRVETYFGMRKIECIGDKVYLNHVPIYQKLVLDQGYWEEGLLTPPNKKSFLKDVKLVKEMGFNGIRKHQKIESPTFLYYADCMGVLVWEEMPSNYEFTEEGMRMLQAEYQEVLMRDYNHPCIITWVPFNESWGIRDVLWNQKQQAFALSLYYLTKAFDDTRPISTNDGWEAVTADMLGIHDYESSGEVFYEKYKDKDKILSGIAVGKMIYAKGFAHHGEPIFLSEFGGIAMEDGSEENWGYDSKASNEEELFQRMEGLFAAIHKLPYLSGYCYTQLMDVKQETNGILRADRTPKIELAKIREIV